MAVATAGSSPETSPTESEEIEKGDFEKANGLNNETSEREEEEEGHPSVQVAETGQPDPYLRPPGHSIRSHSSARSQRSYTDGYAHYQHDENDAEKKGQAAEEGAPADASKEFEVKFDGDSDPMSPRNKGTLRKWVIVLIGSSCSLCVTCASALYTSTYRQLEVDFGVSREVATLGLTTFVCGLGLGPMFLSPLSEFYGRRIIYICAFGMYFIWLIPCAVAQNIQTMLIVRFFNGLAGSAFLSVAGGTVGDMFPREKLSAPMMIYTASPFLGPEVGPVIGGQFNCRDQTGMAFCSAC